jgi:Di-haem oxidoreductase, putative peroxidase
MLRAVMAGGARRLRGLSTTVAAVVGVSAVVWLSPAADAQLTDITQTPNEANAGIQKSLEEQIGAGQGDVMTPDASLFIIQRDPFRAIRRGRQVFQRKFTVAQGAGPRVADGVGDIETTPALGAGLADSCAGCHGRPRGSAGFGGSVFTRPEGRDAPHLFGVGLKEMLADEITADLRAIRSQAIDLARRQGRPVTRPLTSKGIDYGAITARPDGRLDTSSVDGVDPDLRVRPFLAHGATISLREFIVGAFDGEMGLQAQDPELTAASAGGRMVTPAGMVLDGARDRIAPPRELTDSPGGTGHEIPTSLVDHVEFYLLNYFTPGTYRQTPVTEAGRRLMAQIGCTQCHTPDLPLTHDRRVADVETRYDPQRGGLNRLFATATPLHGELDDGSGFPLLKLPLGQPFLVRDVFADFKRHDLGPEFHERQFDDTVTTQFMTAPLWGVGSTAPYGHDGRSINLEEVILRHGGEAHAAREAFAHLSEAQQGAVLRFLASLVLFPPDDTASNLDPGSIRLTVLFNDASDPE